MCRICGRMLKCIFDSMPSRAPSAPAIRSFSTAARQPRHTSSRQLLRKTFDITSSTSSETPSFLFPYRSNLHTATAVQQEISSFPQPPSSSLPPPDLITQNPTTGKLEITLPPPSPSESSSTSPTSSSPPTRSSPKPLVISKSLQSLLPALLSQPPFYITTHIHRFPYLLTTGDTLRLPFHLHGVFPGDILRFNRASIIGSREYTLKAGLNNSEVYDGKRREPNYLDERLYECRVRVIGVENQPMTMKEKTKRRNRKVKTVRSKHKYTVCKVIEVRVRGLEELKGEEGVVLLE